MENNKKKTASPEINEELMMNLMAEGVKKEGLQLPEEHATPPSPSKARNRVKKTSITDYEAQFFKKPETNARDGKTVYIQPDYHEKLTRIVQVIGEDKITIYAYLDNVLEYHFKEFGEQIIKSFNDKYKPIL